MGERNLRIEYWREQLERLTRESETLQKNIPATPDPIIKQSLEAKLMLTFDNIDQAQASIDAIDRETQTRQAQARDTTLLDILQTHTDGLDTYQDAYQITIVHWPTALSPLVTTPETMLRELKRISSADGYSALEEFISQIMAKTTSNTLLDALNAWGQRHYPERDWLALHQHIQQRFARQVADFQPAILVRLRLAEETTTQTDNVPHYGLSAWLVEDMATYQAQRTGYHPLVLPDTEAAQPVAVDDVDSHIQPLLSDWIRQTWKILPDCNNDPEFHIFLPKALLQLKVDCWQLDNLCLGHAYNVVVCCSDRLDGPYPRKTWRRLWDKHQTCLTQPARQVFVDDDGQDIDRLAETLDRAIQTDNSVGLAITAAPCEPTSDDLFEELLLAGWPVALWGRCQSQSIQIPTQLDTILQAGDLGNLPQAVQRKRREARRISPDRHIGHHLVLLKDNPKLIPPQSA